MARDSTWSIGRSLRLQAVVNLVASHWNHGIVFLQLALNAVVGYGFTRMLANMYGVSAAKDGFDIAYSVPFIILNLSGFAFGHAVISTHFAKLRVTDPEKLQVVFSTILHLMLLVGALLVGACYVWDEQLIQLLAPGLPAAARDQARQSMLLMLPLTFTLGLSAYWSAVLVAFKVPFTAEACQLISRLGVLVWFLASGPAFGFVGISLGLVGASVSGLAFEWFVLRKYTGLSLTLDFSPRDPKVREVVWQGSSFLVATLV
ncbi:MAG: hypothetical protein KDA57_05455, partial [Planctomycetales bacterium]|nr:hypothetical protein [Planctomycetales bacterium]